MRNWVAAGDAVALVSTGATRLVEMLRAAGIEVERSATLLHLRERGASHLRDSNGAPHRGGVAFVDHGSIESGFAIPGLRLHVLGDREIFGQRLTKRVQGARAQEKASPVTLADLRVGAPRRARSARHRSVPRHTQPEAILGATQDYLDLRFAGTDRLLVPVTQMHQVTKYGAAEGATPRLSKMGGGDWARTKARVAESLAKIADGLVAFYAERELAQGHAFPPDTPWQAEVRRSVLVRSHSRPAEDDPEAVKADMEHTRPMDRLVCGGVGYRENRSRGARRVQEAIADRRQVAVLVPTTLLAAQHYRTFGERFASFPIRIEQLSRVSSGARNSKPLLLDFAAGKVDLRHRGRTGCSAKFVVVFKDLGQLIVVDEGSSASA